MRLRATPIGGKDTHFEAEGVLLDVRAQEWGSLQILSEITTALVSGAGNRALVMVLSRGVGGKGNVSAALSAMA